MTLLLLMATQAHASAYFFLDSNTRAIGRGGANVAGGFILRGLVYISVAGTLKLQWAQNTATSGVTNTLYTGSCMIGTKVG